MSNLSVDTTTIHIDAEGPPSSPATINPAVVVRNATKAYQNGIPIINNMSMCVPEGSIYGLLGSSGCGKTTILSSIVGLRELDSGTVLVYGNKPGTADSGIPGRTLGYMPQDYALYTIFTIEEILQYFGRIYGMTKDEVKARIEFLIGFLDLPGSQSLIKNLSGGQQRRVSLSIAMLHSPKLLILDEPTVGVDPLIRESIWEHLREVVQKQKTTIIITTHYIEEAKLSDTVGIMRNGRLLVESCPQLLLEQYHTQYLEQVFLKLCTDDEQGLTQNTSSHSPAILTTSRRKSALDELEDDNTDSGKSYQCHDRSQRPLTPHNFELNTDKSAKGNTSNHLNKIASILIKNILTLIRTPWFLIPLIFIPAFQVAIFLYILGHDPKNISLGIVNHEIMAEDLVEYCRMNSQDGCFTNDTSCQFLNKFPPDEFEWTSYSTEAEALASVEQGANWGFMTIPRNYSQHLMDRSLLKNNIENDTLDGTTLPIRLDVTWRLKSNFISAKILTYFQDFLKELASSCGTDSRTVEIPLKFNAIYGSLNTTFIEFIQSAQLTLIIFLLPMASALPFIADKKAGTLQRSKVAGVDYGQIIVAFMISEGFITMIQLTLCVGTMVFGYGTIIEGPIWQFLLMIFLEGIVGLSFGFLFGTVCNHEIEAVFCVLGLYMPIMVSSGATWPIEGLPKWARIMCSLFPTTLPIHSIRSIMTKGWTLMHPQVWPGFLVAVLWIVILCILSAIISKIKNK